MKYIITFLLLIFLSNIGFACSCSRPGILKNQNTSDFVFTGKVVKINEIITQEKVTSSDKIIDYKRYEFVFEIKHIHKGKKEFDYSDRISIVTSGNGLDCGNYFNLDQKYLIYSYKRDYKIDMNLANQKTEKEFMSTDLCTRTKGIKFFTFLEQFVLDLT